MSAENKTAEDVIQRSIGGLRRWHIFIIIVIFLVKFSIAWHQLCIVFLAPRAEFQCSDKTMDKCSSDCPSHTFNRSIFTETIITEWDLVCDRAQLANVVQMTFMFGILIGNVVFGYLSDRFGRRNPLVWAVMLQVVSGVAAAFSPDMWTFMFLRFLCAMATGGTMLTSFVLIMEIVGKKYRTMIGVLFQLPFQCGHATLGLFGYLLRDWHYFQMAISIPSALLISYYWLVPESPRWLLTVGRTKDAVVVLKKAATFSHLPTHSIEQDVTTHLQHAAVCQKNTGNIIDLVRTAEIRKRTFCIFFNWIIIGLTYFGVAQFMGQIGGNIFVNVSIAGLVQIPGDFICIYLLDRLGRKRTIILAYLLAGFSCFVIMFIPSNINWLIAVFGSLGMLGISISFSVIYIYSGELYPTVIRNVGLGTASMFARFGSMTAPFVADLQYVNSWLSPLIFGAAPLICVLVCLLLPETLNCKLPDTVEEAEMIGKENETTIKTSKTLSSR